MSEAVVSSQESKDERRARALKFIGEAGGMTTRQVRFDTLQKLKESYRQTRDRAYYMAAHIVHAERIRLDICEPCDGTGEAPEGYWNPRKDRLCHVCNGTGTKPEETS